MEHATGGDKNTLQSRPWDDRQSGRTASDRRNRVGHDHGVIASVGRKYVVNGVGVTRGAWDFRTALQPLETQWKCPRRFHSELGPGTFQHGLIGRLNLDRR